MGWGVAVHWKVDSESRLFEAVCDGLVEASEIHQMLDALVGSDALGYRKFFDGSRADTNLGPLDVLSIGVRLRSMHEPGIELGPLAVVIPANKYKLLSRVLGILAAARRPMRIFDDPGKARQWLALGHRDRVVKSKLPRQMTR